MLPADNIRLQEGARRGSRILLNALKHGRDFPEPPFVSADLPIQQHLSLATPRHLKPGRVAKFISKHLQGLGYLCLLSGLETVHCLSGAATDAELRFVLSLKPSAGLGSDLFILSSSDVLLDRAV